MFVFIVLIFMTLFLFMSFFNKKERYPFQYNDLVLLLFLLLMFVLIMFFSIYIDIVGGGGKYFPGIFVNDSERYLKETLMFLENPLETNELLGSYGSYKVTPKMGLPSMLANLNLFGIADKYFVYSEFIFISFILCTVNYFLLKKVALFFKFYNTWLFILSFFIFVCFPIEFYWKTRLMREVIVHSLFFGSILLLVLSCYVNKRYFSVFILYCLLIIVFRSQIFLLVLLFSSLFYRVLDFRQKIILISLTSLAFVVMISASGVLLFTEFLSISNLDFIYDVFDFLSNKIEYFYLATLLSTVIFINNKINYTSHFPSAKLFLILSLVLILIVFLQMNSIRFYYPIMLLSITFFFFSLISVKVRHLSI